MAKDKLVINGYTVPGGSSGVAVRRACELILERPGIAQKHVLQEAVRFSGLNFSTAGWITSPGPKSPATLLWDRRKEGVFSCYPNTHTEKVIGAQAALFDELVRGAKVQMKKSHHIPVVGELVECSSSVGYPFCEGVVLGFTLDCGTTLSSTVDAILSSRSIISCSNHIEVVILESGTGRRQRGSLGWHYRPL